MHARTRLGLAGEDFAARTLSRSGLKVIDRNYRCAHGEVDLVASDGRLIVFCEVKTRRTDAYGLPAEAVGWRKQQRLRKLAAHWLRERGRAGCEVRFDVVSVIVQRGRASATHIPDAF